MTPISFALSFQVFALLVIPLDPPWQDVVCCTALEVLYLYSTWSLRQKHLRVLKYGQIALGRCFLVTTSGLQLALESVIQVLKSAFGGAKHLAPD